MFLSRNGLLASQKNRMEMWNNKMTPGKLFEQQFKKSVPSHCYLLRLNDPPQSFKKSKDTRFSPKNPFDFVLFEPIKQVMMCIELKTTKSKSMSFDDVNIEEEQNNMIHKHQIEGLTNASEFNNISAGFLLNFRDEKNDMERCYWQDVKDFNKMVESISKKSFNELDLLTNNAIKVDGTKKRIHYIWDIESLLSKIIK